MAAIRKIISTRWPFAVIAFISLIAAQAVGASSLATVGAWSELPPLARVGHSVIYDRLRDRLVLYGGNTGAPPTRAEVWSFALASNGPWRRVQTLNDGPAREFHGAAYDPLGDRMIIFGGATRSDAASYQEFSDVWALSLGSEPTWTQLAASGAGPSDRWRPAVIFDSRRNRLVVAGGSHSGTWASDTWRLDLNGSPAWSAMSTTFPPSFVAYPASMPRLRGGASYDSLIDCMLAIDDKGSLHGFWALQFSGADSGRWGDYIGGSCDAGYLAAALDPISQTLYGTGEAQAGAAPIALLNGFPNACFLEQNRSLFAAPIPVFDGTQAMVWDELRGRPLSVGGGCWANDQGEVTNAVSTFTIGPGAVWSRLDSPRGAPCPRYDASIAYDSRRDRILIQGGYLDRFTQFGDDGSNQALWAMSRSNPGAWSTAADSARGNAMGVSPRRTVIYDPVRDRLLVAYGTGAGCQVFAFPLDSEAGWTPIPATGTIPPFDGRLRFDSAGNRAILIDWGLGVWALTLDSAPVWTRVDSGPPPSAYLYDSVILDAARQRLLLLTDGPAFWTISLAPGSTWTKLVPTGIPMPTRPAGTAVCDSAGSRMVIFGASDDGARSEVLALSLESNPTLTRLSPAGIAPPALNSAAADIDPIHHQLIVFGGQATTRSATAWTLDLDADSPTPALVSLIDAVLREGAVQVRWQAVGAARLWIERQTDSAGWEVMTSGSPDGSGRVSFVDRDVTPGHRYGYRLLDANGPIAATEAWVDVPKARFALALPAPNPSTGVASVQVTLPDAGAARLDVVDLAGRRELVWNS